MLDDLADGISTSMTPELIDEKVASMSCKAAVKGNNRTFRAGGRRTDRGTVIAGESISLPAWTSDDHRNDTAGTGKEI